jgi:hypothetical protein
VILVVLAAVGLALAWRLFGRGAGGTTFDIRVEGEGPEGVRIKGTVPGHGDADVRDFVAGLELPEGAQFWGIPDRERFQIGFHEVPERLQQRIRNYLYMKF